MPIRIGGAGESSSRQGRPGSISPSALMLLTKIKRLAPARAAAAATRSVPATLVSWQAARNRGVFSDVSWTRAARCTTVSGGALEHFSVRLHKERARRQYEQYGEREATQGKPLKNALEDRTSANTVCPAALSVWHTALPIKPFAPVTRIFILQFYFLLEDRKRQTDELHIYPGNIRANFTQCVVQHTRFISLLARGQAICQTDQTSA